MIRVAGCARLFHRAADVAAMAVGASDGRVPLMRKVERARPRCRPDTERNVGRDPMRPCQLGSLVATLARVPHGGIAMVTRAALPRDAFQAAMLHVGRVAR
jgi:hypothetical protein